MPSREGPVSVTFPHIRTPWKAIAAELRAAIASGDLKPGGKLPSVHELTARYGVNRATVSKALAALAGEGLAELEPGMGYWVPAAPGEG